MNDRPQATKVKEKPPGSHAARTSRTRKAILVAAAGEFVAHGLEGANIEAIAYSAGVNKALVYRHFSRKEVLFRHVLEDAYRAMRDAEESLAMPSDPVAALDRLVEFTFDYYRNNQGFLTLVGIENLHGGENIRESEPETVYAGNISRMVAGILERGATAGVFRPRLDPVELWLSISNLCWATVSTAHTIRFTFGRDVLAEPARSARLAHIQEMIRRYALRPDHL
ncbi:MULTISPECIES: TetR/AcrR family transcriptional regulator [Rhizobium/Agrobacterium group]|uniref:TetR family transcriptional regulator n=2 Tax=Rhizobium/Agrobacterium group TaxID=227290 RepID=A0AB36ECA7_AGRTU|nr:MULTISPECIES: TetR/AcrR family transcriptional regulator [Rhizobium/Agrobacterium group]HCV73652.1 TetR/AcrR family transcriptional regulator [Agrobacterium sp.]MDR5012013.1 TetR/AcrR family transcriptional regulator [Agrobacterium tumefaciens]NSZ85267.1 TetR/AcrR family transcriptional regulator [Agrobacterium tumefaciens]NTA11628.1 TetR/AcrR family transcriptional regulator [Agrobacterium tumefaciens]NTA17125.1 TetR/AcrR family transcriptional regulator [Agrobacterium tumefaciens]